MSLEFSHIGFAPHYIDYHDAWEQQKKLHDSIVEGKSPSTVMLLEHRPVYTAGKRTEDHERPFDGTPVISVDRGGKLTWHGPGQLVGYPILALPDPTRVVEYVDLLEDIIMRTVATYGVKTIRIPQRSGVWVSGGDGPDRKIASVGIRVNHGVTMHGFSINCNNDLAPFAQIIACGITDAGVTSISLECGRDVSPTDIVSQIEAELRNNSKSLVRTVLSTPVTAPADAGMQGIKGESQ
ncbi:lipoyl(octanoyl) transferase LipB [Arthrobacter roseus]|uniref:lipoyl(octanoyl) transferase LipB n=1 Tax=Arthrobacter roseus TaxID=136274 RepID=UPI001963551C|nr:lipoyl(octanoyl) transferase LipB [Arthrobacter roseus]MBM7848361.1 lipoyl(octanoyl) transferase [Arthrobacter roseus]